MSTIQVNSYDPAWSTAIFTHDAVLCLGEATSSVTNVTNDIKQLANILDLPWQAVYVNSSELPIVEARAQLRGEERGARLRIVIDDPSDYIFGPESVPVFCLQGLNSESSSTNLPKLIHDKRYLNMLSKMPLHQFIFFIGAAGKNDLGIVHDVAQIAQTIGNVIITTDQYNRIDLNFSEQLPSLYLWESSENQFVETLMQLNQSSDYSERFRLRLTNGSGFSVVDLRSCEQPANPILERYELITESDVAVAGEAVYSDLKDYMENPAKSWKPYALGVPFQRDRNYEDKLLQLLRRALVQGRAASGTMYISADSGSGSTTLMRQLCYAAAREGYPVLVARSEMRAFDVRQIDTFIRASQSEIEQQTGRVLPWLIAYDSQNVVGDFSLICQIGRKIGRPVIVLAILTPEMQPHAEELWQSHKIGPDYRNRVTLSEAVELGKHLSQVLKPEQTRSQQDWASFITEVSRIGVNGPESLFWVALRFWLLRSSNLDEPLRKWLKRMFDSIIADDEDLRAAFLEIAVASKYRLTLPIGIVPASQRNAILSIARDRSNPIALERFRSSATYEIGFAHPLIATELLRIAESNTSYLNSIGKSRCYSLHDLELTLFERIMSRNEIGHTACSDFVTELVSTALRVDPLELPSNYEERDRIVQIYEKAPDALFDSHVIFLHRLAIARRHLASKPPLSEPWWRDVSHIREQFELAVGHIKHALRIVEVSEDSADLPENLFTTLGRTYERWSEFENNQNNFDVARKFDESAGKAYALANQKNPDNMKLAISMANRFLRHAQSVENEREKIRYLVEAVSLYQKVVNSDVRPAADETVKMLSIALEMLKAGSGQELLNRMMANGEEVAFIAVAQMRFSEAVDDSQLIDVISLIDEIPSQNRTWRMHDIKYSLVSKVSQSDFNQRVDILNALEGTDYLWPLQKTLEHAILCHQTGDHDKAEVKYKGIRSVLRNKGIKLYVPNEMKFLMDAVRCYQKPLRTNAMIVRTSRVGSRIWAIPEGWANIRVQVRERLFPIDVLNENQEIPCAVQFTFYGPEIVPESEL